MTCIGLRQNTTDRLVWVLAPKTFGPKTTYFQRLRNSVATLRATISDEEHDIDNRELALATTKGTLCCAKIL